MNVANDNLCIVYVLAFNSSTLETFLCNIHEKMFLFGREHSKIFHLPSTHIVIENFFIMALLFQIS